MHRKTPSRLILLQIPPPRRRVPLSNFKDWKKKTLPVFEFEAKASFTPIDVNLLALFKNFSWSHSDRLRFWLKEIPGSPTLPPRITVRKFDREEEALSFCWISVDGNIRILGNDQQFTENFFQKVFLNTPPTLRVIDEWKVRRRWIKSRFSTIMLAAHAAGAMGWQNRVPSDTVESLEEAARDYKFKNWFSCLVMCRRATESMLRYAYRRSFSKEPKALDLNGILRAFETQVPPLIPRYWINVLDSIRNIGNLPGAHVEQSSTYKVSRVDAQTALKNVIAFKKVYFSKIDPNINILTKKR